MSYQPSPARYDAMTYHRCGKSGLRLPAAFSGEELQMIDRILEEG